MTQIPVFTSIETPSQISPFGNFVFTFYLNDASLWQNQTIAREEKILYFCNASEKCRG